jgi:hypothetical protein
MLAYHPYWLEASAIIHAARRWWKDGLISTEQFGIINAAFTNPLYTPPLYERTALFLFTSLCIAGLYLFARHALTGIGAMVLVGIFCIASLEVVVRYARMFRAGIDDALLYGGLACVLGGVWSYSHDNASTMSAYLPFIVGVPVLAFAAMRYVDRISAAGSLLAFVGLAFWFCRNAMPIAEEAAPLVLITAASAGYFLYRALNGIERLATWKSSVAAVGVTSLLLIYGGGNYFFVERFVAPSVRADLHPTFTLDMSGFYYAWTLGLPICYIVLGLARRDRMMLRVGLIAEGASLGTMRYYVNTIALEHSLIIIGAALIMITTVVIQVLKTDRRGFTDRKTPHLLPETVPGNAVVLFDRLTAQQEAVRAFESGETQFRGGGASLGW